MIELGRVIQWAVLLVSAYGFGAAIYSLRKKNVRWLVSARGAAFATTVGITTVVFILEWALLSGDMHLQYIAQESNRNLPALYKMTALWGGSSGSLLFWSWVLSLYTAYIAYKEDALSAPFLPYALPILLGVEMFYSFLITFVTPLFAVVTKPVYDGAGLNPLLENIWMAIHPPMLYMGYVGLTVPFAFGMAALLKGDNTGRWLILTRRWTMVAWLFLTSGILLGAHWSYIELGWGGYWGWDPVENASLMPWLAATAFIHGSMAQEKRGVLKKWNFFLIAITYLLTVLGIFITRSGIVASVHAFSGTGLGSYFMIWFVGSLLFSGLILYRGRHMMRDERSIEHFLSLETAILGMNLTLVALSFAVLWGTLFPLFSQLFLGHVVAVGVNFFDSVLSPFALFLIMLTALGSILTWKRTSPSYFFKAIRPTLIATLVLLPLLYVLGLHNVSALLTYDVSFFALTTLTLSLFRVLKTASLVSKQSIISLLSTQIFSHRRRFGAYLAHVGMVLFVIGAAGTGLFTTHHLKVFKPGATYQIAGYQLRYAGTYKIHHGLNTLIYAHLAVYRNGHKIGILNPAQEYYPGLPQNVAKVAIRSTWRGDLYTVLAGWQSQGRATIEVISNPLIELVWFGLTITVIGGLWAATERKLASTKERALKTASGWVGSKL